MSVGIFICGEVQIALVCLFGQFIDKMVNSGGWEINMEELALNRYLVFQNENLILQIYDINWTEMGVDQKKDLLFLLQHCQQPLSIMAGNIIELNFTLLARVGSCRLIRLPTQIYLTDFIVDYKVPGISLCVSLYFLVRKTD